MPRVYLTEADRKQAAAERHHKKMIASIYGHMKAEKITTTDLGRIWDCTQQNAARKVRLGLLTITDLWKMQELLQFSDSEILDLIRGDRDPVAEYENGGADAVGSRPRRIGNRQQ